jgi:hypothetical protein
MLALLSLTSNSFIILEVKLYKAMPFREVRLIIYINIILPNRGINTRKVKKT